MTHLLVHLMMFAGLGVLTWLPGVAAERFLAPCPASSMRWLARWILGLALWTGGLFCLAACQLLRLEAMSVMAMIGAVAGALALRAEPPGQTARSAAVPRGTRPLLMIGLAVLLAPSWLVALGPTVSWDASAYHLTLPRLFLEHGGFRPVPMNVYSVWPLGTDLLFAPALAVGGPELAKLVHFGLGLLVLGTLWRMVGAVAGWLAASLFLLNGVVLFELRVAYVDLGHALYLLAAVLFTHRAVRAEDPRGRQRWLVLGGVAAALLVSVKVTGIASVAWVGLAILGPWWLGQVSRHGWANPTRTLWPWLVPTAGAGLLWSIRATWLTGNPIYPFLHKHLGGPDWSAELGAQLQAWQRSIGMGRELVDYVLLPLRVTLAGGRGYERFDGELAAVWLIAVPIAIWGARRSSLAGHALVVAGFHFPFWAATAQQSRFLIPTLALLALAFGLAVRPWFEALEPRRMGLAAVALVVMAITAFVSTEPELVRSGAQHLRLFTDPTIDLDARKPYPPVFEAVDTLADDANVLLLNTNQGFFCRREFLADSFFEASQISHWLAGAADAMAVRQRLAERGVTHILLDRRPRGAQYPRALLELLQDQHAVRPIHQDQGFVLLELR